MLCPVAKALSDFISGSSLAQKKSPNAILAKRIVIATHGGSIGVLFRHVLGIPLDEPRRFWCRNASLNVFLYEQAKWRLESWGDINHLRELDGPLASITWVRRFGATKAGWDHSFDGMQNRAII